MASKSKRKWCILDLITDTKTGKISTSKVWLNIGHITLTRYMWLADNLTWEDMLAYGTVVAGSHGAIYFIKARFGNAPKSID